jgi:hypothetical protein
MADGIDPASEQAGTPSPNVGSPSLGLPSLGIPSLDQGSETSQAGDAKPEIVDGFPGAPPPQRAPRPRRFLTTGRIIAIGLIALAALGGIVRAVRQASATPADKQACASILSGAQQHNLLNNPEMMTSLSQANDKPLYAAYGLMLTDVNARNLTQFVTDLNQAIHRCNQISNDFKQGFLQFCDQNEGLCKREVHVGPF